MAKRTLKLGIEFFLTLWGSVLLHGLLILILMVTFYGFKDDSFDYKVEYLSAPATFPSPRQGITRRPKGPARMETEAQSKTLEINAANPDDALAVFEGPKPASPSEQNRQTEIAALRQLILTRISDRSLGISDRLANYFRKASGNVQVELVFRPTSDGYIHFDQADLIPVDPETKPLLNSWMRETVFLEPIFWKVYDSGLPLPSSLRMGLKVNPFLKR